MTDILSWFPKGMLSDHPVEEEGRLSIPVSSQQWVVLNEVDLTEREKQIIQLLTEQSQRRSSNPWGLYLLEGQGNLPKALKKVQLVYVHLTHFQREGLQDWLEMMRTILPNHETDFQIGAQDYLFVLDQDHYVPIREMLEDTLSAMEYDFNVKLSMMVGQVWPLTMGLSLSALVGAERELFQYWRTQEQASSLHRVSQLYLWGLSEGVPGLGVIRQGLSQLIASQDQLAEIVVALWDNAAVVTKAAQQLYLHRNSLQYKIDRWEELTGLQLKDLTDLCLCYQVMLSTIL